MSNVVDQRTVEMLFDNGNFEKNVATSMKTIAEFTKSLKGLKSDEASKSFESIGKQIKSLDFSKTAKSFDLINAKFKDLVRVSGKLAIVKELQSTFNSLTGTIMSTAKSMSQLSQLTAGWNKYAEKTTSVQTIMSATGKSIDEVTAALDKLNWYSDETSASFTDMTSSIGKFTSAGVKLEDAVKAMEGIFNWTSASGRQISDANRVMYNLSQAVGVGSVKLMDWRSIENANMATLEFKNTVLDTGVALGKLKKVGDDYYTTAGKKQKITAQNFSSTLNTGWFDSQLLISTLKRYSEFTEKVYQYMEDHPEFDTVADAMDAMKASAKAAGEEFDELGYKWFLSAQEAKTFEDVVNSIKDATSTGWMKTFELIFGNYEQARHMWTDLANDLYEVFVTPMNDQNDFLSEVMTSGYSKLKKEILKAGLSVEDFEKQLYDSIATSEIDKKILDDLISKYGSLGDVLEIGKITDKEVLDDLISKYGSLGEIFKDGKINVELITKAFEGLADAGKDGKKTTATVEEIQQIMKDTFAGKYGVGKERQDAYEKLGYSYEKLQKLVSVYTKKGKLTIEDIEDVGISAGKATSEVWEGFIEQNGELIESLDEVSGRSLLIGGMTNIVKSAVNRFVSVRDAFNETFAPDPEKFHDFLENFYNFTDRLKLTEEGAEKLKNFATGMFFPIKSLANVGGRIISAFFGDTFESFGDKAINVFNKVANNASVFQKRFTKVFKSLEDSKYVSDAINKVSEWGKAFRESFSSSSFSKAFNQSFIGSAFTKTADKIKSIWEKVNANGGNAFDNLIEAGKIFKDEWMKEHADGWNPFTAIWDGIKTDFEKIKSSKIFTSAKSAFDSVWNSITGLFKKEPPGVKVALKQNNPFQSLIQNVEMGISELNKRFSETVLGRKLSAAKKALPYAIEEFKTHFFEKGWTFGDSFKKAAESFSSSFKKFFDMTAKRIRPQSKVFEAALKAVNLKNSIKNALTGGTKGSMLDGLKDEVNGYKDFMKGLPNSIGKSFSTVKEKIESFWNAIRASSKKSEEAVQNKKDVSANILGIDLSSLDKIKEKLKSFWDWVRPLLKMMAEGFAKDFNTTNLSKLLTSIATLGFSRAGYGLGKSASEFFNGLAQGTVSLSDAVKHLDINNLPKVYKNLSPSIKSLAETFTTLKENKNELKARTILEFAAAITLVSVALYMISKIQKDDLIKAGIVVVAITAVLVGISFALSKMGSIEFKVALANNATIFKAIAIILAISIALKNVGKAAKAMSEAIAMLKDTAADFSDLAATKVQFQKGIQAINDLALALGTGSMLAGFGLGNIFGGTALTILSMAASIRILVDAVKTFTAIAEYNPEAMQQAIDNISKLMYMLGDAVMLTGLTGGFAISSFGRAATILAFVAAIELLQNAVKEFVSLAVYSPEALQQAIDNISQLMYMIGNAAFWSGMSGGFGLGSFGRAAAILSIGFTVRTLVSVIKEVMDLSENPARFEKARETVIHIMKLVAGIVAVLGIIKGFEADATLGQAASIVAIGLAIRYIGDALSELSKLNKSRLEQGEGAVAVIAGIISGVVLVMGLISKFTKFSIKDIGSGAMIIGLGTAIKSIGDAIIKLSDLDKDKLDIGMKAARQIAVIIGVLMAVAGAFKVGKSTFGVNTLGLCVGIYAIGLAIEKIGGMDPNVLKQGGNAVGQIAIVLAACVAIMNIGAKTGSWTNALNIAALTGSLFVLVGVAEKFGKMEKTELIKAGVAIVGLLGALTLVNRYLSKMGSISNVYDSVGLLIMSAAVALLAEIAKGFAEMEWPELGKVGAGLGGMIAAMFLISKLVKVAVGTSILGIGKLGVVVAAIAAVLAVLGHVFDLPLLSDGLDKGAKFLGKIGTAIGEFLGGIAGGAISGWANALPGVGSKLSEFADNAGSFFETIKGLEGVDIGGILLSLVGSESVALINEGLANILNLFTGGTIGGKYNPNNVRNFGALKGFGDALEEISPGVEAFIAASQGAVPDKINSITAAFKELSRINFREVNVKREEGEKSPLAKFADEIVKASTSIEEAINALNGLPTLTDNASNVIESLLSFGNTVFTKNGFRLETSANGSLWKNDENGLQGPEFDATVNFIVDLGSKAENYINALGESKTQLETFFSTLNSINLAYDETYGKSKASVVSEALDEFASIDISNWYGANIKQFSDFTSDLVKGIGKLKTFIDEINNNFVSPDENKFASFLQVMTDLAAIDMPTNFKSDGFTYLIDPTSLVTAYLGAIDQIDVLAEELEKHSDSLEIVKGLTAIYSIFDTSKEIDFNRLEGLPTKLGKFVTDFNKELAGQTIDSSISEGLTSIKGILLEINDIKEVGFSEVAVDITSGISNLASINTDEDKTLQQANATVTWFSSFVTKLLRIQNSFSKADFQTNLSDAIQVINETMATMHDPGLKIVKLTQLFDAIKSLYDLDFSYVGGEANLETNKLAAAFAILSDAIDEFRPDSEISDLEAYISWIEGLAGKKDTFSAAGEALKSFVPDTTTMRVITNFVNSLKGDFLKYPFSTTPEIKETVGWDGPKFEEVVNEGATSGYFESVANDLVNMSNILKTGDFTELTDWTTSLNNFANSLKNITLSNADTVASKIYEILYAINDAILGDGTDKKPALITDVGDKFGVFDTISEVFSQINGYKNQGLESVIPNILGGISTSINDFTYKPDGLAKLKTAVEEMKKILGIGGEETEFTLSGPRLGLFSDLDKPKSGRVRPQSKADEAAQKAADRIQNGQDADWINSLSEALNGMSVDPEKVTMIQDISSALSDVAKNSVQANSADFGEVTSQIASSLEHNKTDVIIAGDAIGLALSETFQNMYPVFFETGAEFIFQICQGMYSQSVYAIETAATMATMMLNSFKDTVSTSAMEVGTSMVTSIADAIGSEDNSTILSDAFDSLLGITDSEAEGSEAEYNPGAKFAEKFMKGFQDGLSLEDPDANPFTGFIESLNSYSEGVDFSSVAETIASGATDAVDVVSGPVELLGSTLSAAVPDGAGLANAMIDGIIAALQARVEETCAEMALFASLVAGAAKSALGIHSPSKVFYEIGENTVDGFVNAVNDNTGNAAASFGRLASLSVKQANYVFSSLKKGAKFVNFKGMTFSKADLSILRSYIKTYSKTKKSGDKASVSVEGVGAASSSATENMAEALSEVQEAADETSDKIKIDGIELSLDQVKKLLNLFGDENNEVELFGHLFTKDSIEKAKNEILAYKDEIMSDLNKDSEFTLTPVLDWLGIKDSKPGIKGGLIDSALATGSSAVSKAKQNIEAIGSIGQAKIGDASSANGQKNVAITFNQRNESPKALPASEIWRHTNNQLSKMKRQLAMEF